eukprot:361128-Chlamydomonas_euryale.AAC.3
MQLRCESTPDRAAGAACAGGSLFRHSFDHDGAEHTPVTTEPRRNAPAPPTQAANRTQNLPRAPP